MPPTTLYFMGIAATNNWGCFRIGRGPWTYEYANGTKIYTTISPASGKTVSLGHFKFMATTQVTSLPTTAQVWVNGTPAFTSATLVAIDTYLDVDLTAVGPFSVNEAVTVAVTFSPRAGLAFVGVGSTIPDSGGRSTLYGGGTP